MAKLTIKSLSEEVMKRQIKLQDFAAATLIREMHRAVDPYGGKELDGKQARAVKAFLKVLVAKA